MEKGEEPIFLKVFLLMLIILLINTAYFFYQYKLMENKGFTGLSIQGVVYESYSKMSFGTRIFLIVQWVFLLILLLYSFLKDLRKKNIKAPTIDFQVQKTSDKNKTDLDTLYEILKERKEISIPSISKFFNVSREIADDWCKILESGELVTVEYPSFSEPVVRIIEKEKIIDNSKEKEEKEIKKEIEKGFPEKSNSPFEKSPGVKLNNSPFEKSPGVKLNNSPFEKSRK